MADLFPTDDVTLLAVEHALDAGLTYDRPEKSDPEDEGPWVVGADYTMDKVLDFIGGTTGEDPNGIVLEPGLFTPSDAPHDQQMREARWSEDTRPTYTRDDVIRALIIELRALREAVETAVGDDA